ncbi:hypothetical protein OfM1_09110 [Lactovum odontotermitis]
MFWRLLLYLIQSVFVFADAKPSLILLGIFTAGISFVSKLSDLTTRIMFSEIVPKNELEKYNGIKSVLDNIASFGAPVIGSAFYGICGFAVFSIISSSIHFIALILLVRINYTQTTESMPSRNSGFLSQFKDGLVFLWENKAVLRLSILAASLNFFVASSGNITNPGILIQEYSISSQLFGFVEVAFSLGVLFSGVFIAKHSKINLQKNIPIFLIVNSVIMIGLGVFSFLMFNLLHSLCLAVFLILQIELGFVTILFNVPIMSFYQSHVPNGFQGRFFALSSFIGSIAISVGTSYAGFISQKLDADSAYIFNYICVIVIVVVVMFCGKPDGLE